jgi:hypothetical protein
MATIGHGKEHFTVPGVGIKRTGKKKTKNTLRYIDGTSTFSKDKMIENWKTIEEGRAALAALARLVSNPPKNVHKQIQLYRSLSKAVINYQFMYQDFVEAVLEQQDRLVDGMNDRARKRWTDEEDEVLIELASQDDESATTIALALGRTPSAVQTRLSYLVGINKTTATVAGRFVGWLNGKHVEGDIDGIVSKDGSTEVA